MGISSLFWLIYYPTISGPVGGASQRDLFFLNSDGDYVTEFNITNWNYNTVYNQIINLLPESQ